MKLGRALPSALFVLTLSLGAAVGCSGTLDSLGGQTSGGQSSGAARSGGAGGASASGGTVDESGEGGTLSDAGEGGAGDRVPTPNPLTHPASYPNPFIDLLGKAQPEIDAKLSTAFDQLFHSTKADEAIYVPVGTDQAYIHDVFHDDIRSEGIGVCMVVAVELGKRDEFDRLWTYAKANLEETTGAGSGYFDSICDDADACLDPYGMEQFATALLFAHGRWGSTPAAPYGSDALRLIALLRDKEAENGGVVDDVTSVFDGATALPREQPTVANAPYTRSSLQMPAAFELWAEASGDAFWTRAASAAHAGVVDSADAKTGLWPVDNYFDGTPVAGADFRSVSYRTHFNLALDTAWGRGSAAEIAAETAVADRLLGFFFTIGLDKYGAMYNLDGTVTDATRQPGLIAANGALAVASSYVNRKQFVTAVWNEAIPTGPNRYYDGILYLTSLLVLSGQYQIW